MRTAFATLIASLTLGLAGLVAHADPVCDLKIQASDISLTWSPSLATQSIPLTILKKKNPVCIFMVGFTRGGGTDYNNRRMMRNPGTNTLRYQLYRELSLSNILQDWPSAGSNEAIWDSFPMGKDLTKSYTYYLSIPSNLALSPTIVKSGTYRDTFSLKAYANLDFISPDDTQNITIETYVPPIIDISLVGTGQPFSESDTSEPVNFGTLVTGDQRSLDLLVRSNAGYTISFSSQNGGTLKHATSSITTTVPYTLKVNGVTKPLPTNQTVVVASGTDETSYDGVALPVSFTIGDVTDKVAGPYSDTITVTATTN